MPRLEPIVLALALTASCGKCVADTLNFEPFPAGGMSSVLVLPGATITGSVLGLFNASASFFTGAGGAIASVGPGGIDLRGDMTIQFAVPVNGLSFETTAYRSGDSVTIMAYAGMSLVRTITAASAQVVDFSSAAGITSLYFDDNSSSFGAGFAYGRFSFSSAVPEPGGLALMVLGAAVIGFKRLRYLVQTEA